MAERLGICTNFGECARADSKEAIGVPVGVDFVCLTCGKELTEVHGNGGLKWSRSRPLLILLALLAVTAAAVIYNNLRAHVESISISGATSVEESKTIEYVATAFLSDGTNKSVDATWAVSPTTYASISTKGVLITKEVPSDQNVTITATYSEDKTKIANCVIVIKKGAVTTPLSQITINGPPSIEEKKSARYAATGSYSDNTSRAVDVIWSVSPDTYVSISSTGYMTAKEVPSDQTVTITATYSEDKTKIVSYVVAIKKIQGITTLSQVTINGPSWVEERKTARYAATASYSDNTSRAVDVTWSVSPGTYASISSTGDMTANEVPSDQTVTINAAYSEAGVNQMATSSIRIKKLPSEPPLDARVDMQQGMLYARVGDYENAIREFSSAINKYPQFGVAYSNRGAAYIQQRKYTKALDDLTAAVELLPSNPVIHYNLAAVYSVQNQPKLAIDSLDKALSLGFNNIAALRDDPDLNNLRSGRAFKKILESHKIHVSQKP